MSRKNENIICGWPTMCVILDSSWSHYQPALMMDASFYIRRMEPKRVSNVQNYIGSLLIMYSWAWEKENKSLMYVRHMYIQCTYCFTIYLNSGLFTSLYVYTSKAKFKWHIQIHTASPPFNQSQLTTSDYCRAVWNIYLWVIFGQILFEFGLLIWILL